MRWARACVPLPHLAALHQLLVRGRVLVGGGGVLRGGDGLCGGGGGLLGSVLGKRKEGRRKATETGCLLGMLGIIY